MTPVLQEPGRKALIGAGLITAVALLLVLRLDLLPALLAGLLVHEVVHELSSKLTFVRERRARLLAAALIAVAVVGLLGAATFACVMFFRSETGGYVMLLQKAAEIIQTWRARLPPWIVESVPHDADALQSSIGAWLKDHMAAVRSVGRDGAQALARILIGMVIGALVAVRRADAPGVRAPLAQALSNRAIRLDDAFRRVVFAQLRIAALNAALTAFYVAVVLPLLGIHLPLIGAMVAVTFVAGLVPVIGNLISNAVVVVVSLSVSPLVAFASLAYLVAIHKLEYFLNARLVGVQIQARAWELLLAMLCMEAAFGIPGLVAAPIYYAYLKAELTAAGWI